MEREEKIARLYELAEQADSLLAEMEESRQELKSTIDAFYQGSRPIFFIRDAE